MHFEPSSNRCLTLEENPPVPHSLFGIDKIASVEDSHIDRSTANFLQIRRQARNPFAPEGSSLRWQDGNIHITIGPKASFCRRSQKIGRIDFWLSTQTIRQGMNGRLSQRWTRVVHSKMVKNAGAICNYPKHASENWISRDAPFCSGKYGPDNRAAGRWRGSSSQMARRAQRAGCEHSKGTPSKCLCLLVPSS